jgi:hypothetical protein
MQSEVISTLPGIVVATARGVAHCFRILRYGVKRFGQLRKLQATRTNLAATMIGSDYRLY